MRETVGNIAFRVEPHTLDFFWITEYGAVKGLVERGCPYCNIGNVTVFVHCERTLLYEEFLLVNGPFSLVRWCPLWVRTFCLYKIHCLTLLVKTHRANPFIPFESSSLHFNKVIDLVCLPLFECIHTDFVFLHTWEVSWLMWASQCWFWLYSDIATAV